MSSCGRPCNDGHCCARFRVCVTPEEAASLGHSPGDLSPCDENLVALPQKEDGSCAHQGDNGVCLAYDIRPSVCRNYECAHDNRMVSR